MKSSKTLLINFPEIFNWRIVSLLIDTLLNCRPNHWHTRIYGQKKHPAYRVASCSSICSPMAFLITAYEKSASAAVIHIGGLILSTYKQVFCRNTLQACAKTLEVAEYNCTDLLIICLKINIIKSFTSPPLCSI